MFTTGAETGGTYEPPQLGVTPPSLSDGSHAPGGPGGIQPPDLSGLGGLLGGLAQVIGGHGLLGAIGGQNGPTPEERQRQILGYLNAINTGTGMVANPAFTQFQNEYAAAERAAAARFQALTGTAIHPIPDAGPDLPPPQRGAEPRDFPPPGEEPQPPDMPTPSPTGPIPGFTPPGAIPEPRDLPPPDLGPQTDRAVTTAPRVPNALPPEIREIPVPTEEIPSALPPEIRGLVPPEIPDTLPPEIRGLIPQREAQPSAPTERPRPIPGEYVYRPGVYTYPQTTPVPTPVRIPYEAPTSQPIPSTSPRPYPSTGPAPVPSPVPTRTPPAQPFQAPPSAPTLTPPSVPHPYTARPVTIAPPMPPTAYPPFRPITLQPPTASQPLVTTPTAEPQRSRPYSRPVFFGSPVEQFSAFTSKAPRISQAEYLRWLKTLAAIRANMAAAR